MKQLLSTIQVVLVLFALLVLMPLVFVPTTATSILAFLMALKALTTR